MYSYEENGVLISDIAFAFDGSFIVTAPQIRELENNGARVFRAIETISTKKDTERSGAGRPTGNARKVEQEEDWTAWKDNTKVDSARSVQPKKVLTSEDSLMLQRRKLHQDSVRAGLIRY